MANQTRTWPTRPRVVRGLRPLTTEAIAIGSAHAQGIQWVADFGQTTSRSLPAEQRCRDGGLVSALDADRVDRFEP